VDALLRLLVFLTITDISQLQHFNSNTSIR
jgi:hypothetical protein